MEKEKVITQISEDSLPLREPTFFILLSLAPGKKHGYAILKDVESMSGGKLQLSTGTLYGALSRLLTQDLVEFASPDDGEQQTPSPGKPRKAYRLTSSGRKLLQAEQQRLQSLLTVANRYLGDAEI